ncbi:acid phosphatase type 7-like isoform X2 [Corticium candelabrum]|uniref:acid phosphatase type 7-like isoform X2 n=1 Tax=Corticium candelabrum TaxID=121492 RepID=UPI002E26A917|nr:acid phosphatase type 7-like isoform X2 [Corticium candelabrum]
MDTRICTVVAFVVFLCLECLALKGPEQIHIAYGSTASEMVVMWSTSENSSSIVHYRHSSATNSTKVTFRDGECRLFTFGNEKGLQYIHWVHLTDLTPGQSYDYQVESNSQQSQVYSFTAMRTDKDWVPQFIFYGDMGRHGGAPILPHLKLEVKTPPNAAIFHVGDFAYDLSSEGGINGDEFMNRIQDIAAVVPYMTAVGNHEINYNFSHYLNRFTMPTNGNGFWYSINIANIHFISYSTEVYFTNGPVAEQLLWLKQDLNEANRNRDKQPWIIAFGHRPMYCSNLDGDDCTTSHSVVRAGLESVFYENGVDVIIQGHEHSYERLWPVYNETVTAKNYINPKAPVHIISGAAGCSEVYDLCVDPMLGPRDEYHK